MATSINNLWMSGDIIINDYNLDGETIQNLQNKKIKSLLFDCYLRWQT